MVLYYKWRNFLRWLGFNIKENQVEIILNPEKSNTPRTENKIIRCKYEPCKKILRGFIYKCPYCKGKFCEDHRLPEEHDCEDAELPHYMRVGYGVKNSQQESESANQAEKN